MILKAQTIFIFGISRFDGLYESTSFTTAKFLAQDNDVFYIDYPYTAKDYLKQKGDEAFEKRKSAFFSVEACLLDTEVPRLKILIVPPLLSINFLPENGLYRMLLALNEGFIVRRVKSLLKRLHIKEFVFINSFNFHYPGVGPKLKPQLLVYHCVDPLIVDYDRRHGLVSESIIVKSSDLIICTSKQLYEDKKLVNANTHFIPNAADLTHSSKALSDDCEVSDRLTDIPKPIIGYFGNIERRIDYDLMKIVADANPDKSFLFAGPIEPGYVTEEFKSTANIHFIGRVPYAEMPGVLKGFAIAIIPFKMDEVSRTIFPLKLFEYLGSGRPVVATNFNPDLADFTDDVVSYCETPDEFTACIDNYLSKDSIEARDKRLQIAGENTWDKRLSQLSSLLNQYLNRK